MRRKLLYLFLMLSILTAALNIKVTPVKASTVSAGEMISMINSLRTGVYGLPALIEDTILDSTAYNTAQQMAASGVCAHIGGARERIAAAGFGGGATIFATENMACATSATIDWIQTVWSDNVHMYPMVKPEYTHIGAGAYTASSGITYYVVHAAYMAGGSSPYTSSSSSSSTGSTPTTDLSNFIQPVLTATPNEDGDTYHIVQYGQALSTIASWYGVTVEQIKLLNTMTSDAIYEGQKLLISIKPTVTVTPTRTATVPIPTRTPTLTQVPPTARATVTATPTPKPNLGNFVGHIDRQYLGFGILVASAVGFLIVLLSSFLKPIRKK